MLALDRLVGIGIGADRDGARLVALGRELALEQLRRLGLGEQLGFEVEARRKAEIGVGGAGEAIDAAGLTAALGSDRAIEGNVGRLVAGDDLAGGIDGYRGLERRQFLEALPAVVESDAGERLVAARGVRLRAATAAATCVDRHLGVGRRRKVDGRGAPR